MEMDGVKYIVWNGYTQTNFPFRATGSRHYLSHKAKNLRDSQVVMNKTKEKPPRGDSIKN